MIAETLTLADGAGISTAAELGATGAAGHIDLVIQRSLAMMASTLSSQTAGTGDAGTITIQAPEAVVSLDQGAQLTSATRGAGAGGQINMIAETLTLADGAGISTAAELGATGDAGHIDLVIQRSLAMMASTLSSQTAGTGDAGTITIQAPEAVVSLDQGAQLITTTTDAGRAGALNISAHQLKLTNGAKLSSDVATDAMGAGGQIIVSVSQLEMASGSAMSTQTDGHGDAGQIIITSDEQISLQQDQETASPTSISSAALVNARGQAGQITLSAPTIVLANARISTAAQQGHEASAFTSNTPASITMTARHLQLTSAQITTESTGTRAAGSIQLDSQQVMLNAASELTTRSQFADGGSITLATDRFWLARSALITSVDQHGGDGGDIELSANRALFDGGFIQANAPPNAHGGLIMLRINQPIVRYGLMTSGETEQRYSFDSQRARTLIQAAAPGGIPGEIQVMTPPLDVAAITARPAVQFVDYDTLLANPCATLMTAKPSSLVIADAVDASWFGSGLLPQWTMRRLQRLLNVVVDQE
jgi:uncharacterized lipoprotein NlpE involved in copper resistance